MQRRKPVRKQTVELIDDLNGEIAAETVEFALDGIAYEIDLGDANAEVLRRVMAPYLEKARKQAGSKPTRGGGPSRARSDEPVKARAWARSHGIAVQDRGRVPQNVLEAYRAGDPALVAA